MIYNLKGEYTGSWKYGKRHGEGRFLYPNKDVYSGSWRHGKKDGRGSYHFKDSGMTKFGMWTNNQIIEGHWIYPNGTYFEGKFENNKPVGRGTWNFKDGKKLEGEFEQKPKELKYMEIEATKPDVTVSEFGDSNEQKRKAQTDKGDPEKQGETKLKV